MNDSEDIPVTAWGSIDSSSVQYNTSPYTEKEADGSPPNVAGKPLQECTSAWVGEWRTGRLETSRGRA